MQTFLESYDALPETDQRELASEIIKRSQRLDSPPLTDEELVGAAEETFLELDRRETNHA